MEGLLWQFEGSSNGNGREILEENVRRAAIRYRVRFGRVPNVCFVHPDDLGGLEQVGSVRLRPGELGRRPVLRRHLLVVGSG